jgi:hypothetical protein
MNMRTTKLRKVHLKACLGENHSPEASFPESTIGETSLWWNFEPLLAHIKRESLAAEVATSLSNARPQVKKYEVEVRGKRRS